MESYDVIVIGLGAMGSATTYQLAKSGVKVLAIDQFSPPHTKGSSHGDTRITRLSVGEGSEYVPLVKRSHELWREIERKTGQKLLTQCGGLIMSIPDGQGQHSVMDFVGATAQIAKQYNIKHELLTGEETKSRFPMFNVKGNEHGYYEPEAGYVRPENCISAQIQLAAKDGATIHTNERVLSWEAKNESVIVTTHKDSYQAAKLIITAGAWINSLVNGYSDTFKIYRQVLYWFDLRDKKQYPVYHEMPIFIWMFGPGAFDMVYGFPALDGPNGGLKLAGERYDQMSAPDSFDATVSPQETTEAFKKYVEPNFPGLSSKCVRAYACMYTVTPDYKFVIDTHPEHDNVLVVSPCSGHGFKHSAAIGETLAELATKGKSTIDISRFTLKQRLAAL